MKNFKNYLFLVAAISVISLSSCKNDDDCAAPSISENLVGTWRASLSAADVEFKADGTYVDDEDALLGVEVNGVVYDQRTYVVSGTKLTVTVAPPSGSGSSSIDYEVIQNECDEVKLEVDFFGATVTETLKRK